MHVRTEETTRKWSYSWLMENNFFFTFEPPWSSFETWASLQETYDTLHCTTTGTPPSPDPCGARLWGRLCTTPLVISREDVTWNARRVRGDEGGRRKSHGNSTAGAIRQYASFSTGANPERDPNKVHWAGVLFNDHLEGACWLVLLSDCPLRHL